MAEPIKNPAPLVSVIIPAFNAQATLTEAVESCIRQSEQDVEVLIIEDGSTDNTLGIAERCRQSAPGRVSVLRHDGGSNAGVAASRNLGITAARGEFVAFLDSDDAWLPEKLKIQLKVMRDHPRVGFVFGDVYFCMDPDPLRPMSSQPLELDPVRSGMHAAFSVDEGAARRILNLHPNAHKMVPSPTPLIRRKLFENGLRFAGPTQLRLQYEDYLMWKILSTQTAVHYIEEPLAIYRVHADSFTGRFQQGGSPLRHLLALDDVHEEFVRNSAGDVDASFLASLFEMQGLSILSNAHKIEAVGMPRYLLLASKYRVAKPALARMLHSWLQLCRAGAASIKRSILGWQRK